MELKKEDKNIIQENTYNFSWGKLIIFLFIFLGISFAFLGYLFYRPNPVNINIEIKLPDKILSGEIFDAEVVVQNKSDRPISRARLYLNLPDGVYFAEDDLSKRMAQVEIGDISQFDIFKQSFKLISFSKELTVKTIEAKLTYKLNDSNILFENNAYVDLNISQSALNLLISAPEKIYNTQNFKIVIKYENNSNYDYSDLLLKIDYPPPFKFISSNPNPTVDNNIWKINQIKKNSSGSIELIGQLVGQEGQNANLVISVLKNILENNYTLASQNYILTIVPANLALDVVVNNDPYYVARIGEYLNYIFRYKNNSNTVMENIILTAKLESPLFDFTKIETNAHFDSLNNVFIWNAVNNPQFRTLSPGEQGWVALKIKLKDEFQIQNNNDKNFILKVSAKIESPTIPVDVSSNRTISSIDYENKVNSFTIFEAFGLYRDPAWQILNKGPYPPRVNQLTQYSIHFRIRNYANDISNIRISAVLQPGTRFTGLYKSNIDIKLNYNPDSGFVSINIPKIIANSGILTNPPEVVLQVENIPSANQVNQNITLMSDIKLEAVDDFTDSFLNYSASPITTELPNDSTIKINDRRVSN